MCVAARLLGLTRPPLWGYNVKFSLHNNWGDVQKPCGVWEMEQEHVLEWSRTQEWDTKNAEERFWIETLIVQFCLRLSTYISSCSRLSSWQIKPYLVTCVPDSLKFCQIQISRVVSCLSSTETAKASAAARSAFPRRLASASSSFKATRSASCWACGNVALLWNPTSYKSFKKMRLDLAYILELEDARGSARGILKSCWIWDLRAGWAGQATWTVSSSNSSKGSSLDLLTHNESHPKTHSGIFTYHHLSPIFITYQSFGCSIPKNIDKARLTVGRCSEQI